jgi:hypothetical protein
MSRRTTIIATFALLTPTALTITVCELPRQAAAVQTNDDTIADLKKRVAKLEVEVAEMRKALLRAGGATDSATEVKYISEVAKLRIADLQQRAANTHAILREVMGGKLAGQALHTRINDLNNELATLWVKMASYGLGRDPYLDNLQLSDSGFTRVSSPPDHGIPGPYVALGLPRLHERLLEASGVKGKAAEAKQAAFTKLVQSYSNPGVYTHRDFNERAYNDYRRGINLFTPQYMADLKTLDQWLTELEGVLDRLPVYFEKLP